MNRLSRILLPIIVLAVGIAIGLVLMTTGPEVERRSPVQALPVVEIQQVQPENYQVVLRTQGSVAPRTQSTLIPEVAGRIVSVSARFRSGEFFAAGDELFAIEPSDYQNAVIIARADLARARLAREQEKALAQNALADWQKLGRKEPPTALTLNKPQLAAAEAEVAAAEARLQQAESNLRRTRIRAPYAGRVLEKTVDLGQYVAPGTVAATLYAVDAAEVRLPLTDRQLAFVTLPEAGQIDAPVTLSARIGERHHHWQGRLVRSDAAIDSASRQLFVVAQIDQPFAQNQTMPALKIGQFVEAEIQGRLLEKVFVLPRQAVESSGQVLVVNAQNRIERRGVEVLWREGDQVVVRAGLQAGLQSGERISLTPMPFAREGTAVAIAGEQQGNREYPPLPAPAGH